MKYIITAVALSCIVASCGNTQTSDKKNHSSKNTKKEKMETKVELKNKEKAAAVLTSLETGDQYAIGYINPNNYTQHNLAVADDLAGFGEVITHAPEGGFKAKVVRSFQDGEYAFTHTVYDFFGPKVGFDIFKFENGLITEHWDNLGEITPANPSGHSQSDGATEIKDLDKTEENKKLVKDFIQTVLINAEYDKMGDFFDGDNYIQHNSAIGDGLSGLGSALQAMAKQGVTMVFETNHLVLGEGNFVLAVSEGKFAGEHTSFYDLFRIENGKIAEHWDVIESILPASEHKNSNGKFNF